MGDSDLKEHVLDKNCWCHPDVSYETTSGDLLIIHNEVEEVNEE
jgi:uncharacterized protein YlzI (FlbEa/FlbD family)